MSDHKNQLEYPLPEILVNFIKEDQKEFGDFIVASVECTIKDSTNHYEDLTTALEPLLGEKTKPFVHKLFMYRKRECRLGNLCDVPNCLFVHPSKKFKIAEENNTSNSTAGGSSIYGSIYSSSTIQTINTNREVVFNKVDESMYDISQMKEYAIHYGPLESIRRLNKGKYLLIFESPDSARKLIECTELVMGDPNVKKFYNVMIRPTDGAGTCGSTTNPRFDPKLLPKSTSAVATISRRFDIVELLQEQKEFIERMEQTGDISEIGLLKLVTLRIRNYILQKESKASITGNIYNSYTNKQKNDSSNTKSQADDSESIYSTFFT